MLRCNTATRALTLIELLVVIVILVTLVAGVIPLLSPNNDVRKIREAARGLHTYLVAAQAEAARTGRPQGVGFRETPNGGGVALEAYRLEVPVPFAGFSEDSRVDVTNTGGASYTGALLRYTGFTLYNLDFRLANGALGSDPWPPRMFRLYDTVDIDGNIFMIVDESAKLVDYGTAPNIVKFYGTSGTPVSNVQCIWLNEGKGGLIPQGERSYKIFRQAANSSASPYVFPAGVGIDLQGSVQEGGTTISEPIPESFDTSFAFTGVVDSVAIMFSPSGHVSSLIHNGNVINNVSRIMLLLGRIENGSVAYNTPGSSITSGDWELAAGASAEQIEQKQAEINWLNLDSRWIAIAAQSGRITVSENAFVDPSNPALIGADAQATATLQIEAAHEIGHDMKQLGGR